MIDESQVQYPSSPLKRRATPLTWTPLTSTLLLASALSGCVASGDDSLRNISDAATEPDLTDSRQEAVSGQASCSGTPKLITTLSVQNTNGVARTAEPVRVGIPLPQSLNITNVSDLTLYDDDGTAIPVQATALARWKGSPTDTSRALRWVLLSFQATVPANSTLQYSLDQCGSNPSPSKALSVYDDGTRVTVNTGAASFVLSRGGSDLFQSVTINGANVLKAGNGIVLKDNSGKTYKADLSRATLTVESAGKTDAVVKITGDHVQSDSSTTLLDYTARLVFSAGHSDVRLDYTLHNGAAAQHQNNNWPLGDPQGSRYIEDVSLVLPLNAASTPGYLISAGSQTLSGSATQEVKLYQDSSGGTNYKSENHYDANYWIPIQFQGYRVTSGSATLATGTRVQPWLDISTSSSGIAVGLRQFWQNFPKALSYNSSGVRIGLFPTEFADVFEIQGGEQKTHEMTLYFHSGAGSASRIDPIMQAMQAPLYVYPSSASWYQSSGAFFYEDSTRQGQRGQSGTLEASMDTIIYQTGSIDRTMVSQWEKIDEFGWRNYGDFMADYESDCGYDSMDGPVSHTNNQYDTAFGAINMFARTLDYGFLEVGSAAARHIMDIDINHTTQDYGAYNGGQFWHTTHEVAADTSSHRSYPYASVSAQCTQYTSGGPALGHLYVDGLIAYYFLTGDRVARDAAIELANFAINRHQNYGDEVEGRPYGNYLRTLVNVYRMTGDSRYYSAAVSFLNGAASAYANQVSGTEFKDAMFGKALGNFLDLKLERGETGDADYNKAKSLLQTVVDKAYYATQSNDINATRWSDVLAYGYKHLGRNSAYLNKAKTLYSNLEASYWARGTYSHAKELSILLTNGDLVRYYRQQGL